MKIRYLTLPEVLFIHSAVIDETGGTHGLRDEGLLQSAVSGIEQTFDGKELYPGVIKKAAALFLALLKNHPFIDGNKRTALTVLGVFLASNGHTLEADPPELALWVEKSAASRADLTAVLRWIQAHAQKH